MVRREIPLRRVACALGIFAFLLAPWPGFASAYSAFLRSAGNAAFGWRGAQIQISFSAIARTPRRPLDTRITLGVLDPAQRDGKPRSAALDIDTRGIGWVPSAFFAVLVIMTPIPWGSRLLALFGGACAIQAFVLFSVFVHILRYADAADGVGAIVLGAKLRALVNGLDETLIDQLGAGFFAAAFAWMFSVVRWGGWRPLAENGGLVRLNNRSGERVTAR